MKFFTIGKNEKAKLLPSVVSSLLVTLIIVAFFWLSLARLEQKFDFNFVAGVSRRIGQGFRLTLLLSLAAMLLSLLLGIALAAGEVSLFLPLRYFAVFYVKIIRGTPLISQIYLSFYFFADAWKIEDRFLAGVLILSLFEAAYIAEIIRGSLISLDETQMEAARAVGFNRKQTLRHVVLPQLVARTLPGLTGQFASVIKDSSLLSLIALIELTQTMREISADQLNLFESYLVLGALYLVLTLPVSWISARLERRFRYED